MLRQYLTAGNVSLHNFSSLFIITISLFFVSNDSFPVPSVVLLIIYSK
jgi:hypothetical protein